MTAERRVRTLGYTIAVCGLAAAATLAALSAPLSFPVVVVAVSSLLSGAAIARARGLRHVPHDPTDADAGTAGLRLRHLLASLDAIIWEAEVRPFRITFVSESAAHLFGYPATRWYENPEFREQVLIVADDREVLAAATRNAIEHGADYDCEFRARAADGSLRWMREIGHVERNAAGDPVRLIGALFDVSSRKLAERRLVAQHAVTTVLAEAANVEDAMPRILEAVCTHSDWEWGALWTVDETARVLRFAAGWHPESVALPAFDGASRERTFVSGEGLPGRVWAEKAPAWITDVTRDANFPRAAAAARDDLHGAFAFPVVLTGKVLGVLEFFSRDVRAPDAPLLVTVATLGSQIGHFLERTHTAAERHDLLRREQAARSDAESASRAKDEFLATISHELRAPLTPILLWTRMLQAGRLDEPTTVRALRTIEANVKAQAQLIEDLLDVSRIVNGKLRIEVDAVALDAVVERAVESMRSAADAKGVRIVITPSVGIPPVSGDPGRLQQVVWNLVSNAVKFTPRDGTVHVGLIRDGGDVELSVRDTGEGIDVRFLPHVFERFRQADSASTRVHGGLGLGLTIVRHLVELHGGQVRAESGGVGAGATFVVRLPGRDAALPPADAERATPAAGSLARERLRGLRLLVVDDEPDTLQALTAVLTRAGAELRVADSAAAAMDGLRGWRPDAIVSDVGLPGEDGYALMRRIRALPADEGGDVPAIALTGYARAEDRMRGLEAGFQRHVVKPVDPVELVDMVAALAAESPQPIALARAAATEQQGTPPIVSPAAASGAGDVADEMLTFVSHELRQPLAAMGIWLNLLEAEAVATLSPEAQDHIAQIRASVSWMTELISGRLAEELRNRASH